MVLDLQDKSVLYSPQARMCRDYGIAFGLLCCWWSSDKLKNEIVAGASHAQKWRRD